MPATRDPQTGLQHQWQSRPVRNPHVLATRTESGDLQLVLPCPRSWKTRALRLIFWVPRERRMVLDTVGEKVWTLCDGHRTVRQVLTELQTALPDEPDLDRRLLLFLRRLMERNLLGMLLPECAA